jgi:hypothetical protein
VKLDRLPEFLALHHGSLESQMIRIETIRLSVLIARGTDAEVVASPRTRDILACSLGTGVPLDGNGGRGRGSCIHASPDFIARNP